MKRREFCAGATVALAGLSLAPWRKAHSASDVAIAGLDGRPQTVTSSEVEELRAGLRGELLVPGDADYDAARRLWNPAYNRKPALIVRCVGAADVMHATTLPARTR
jgi:hypothetical protein